MRGEFPFICQQPSHIKHSPSLLVLGEADIHGSLTQKQLDVTVAHFRMLFEQQRDGAGDERRGHGGSAFAGIPAGLVGAADDGGSGGDDVRLADAGAGGAAAGIIDHTAAHDIDFLVVIRTADSDYLAADTRGGDCSAGRAHIAGGDHHHQAVVPGRVDASHQSRVLAHVAAGEGADRDVDDADV